jgi:diadenosine tetraphosphate (Ap4A) HIT family hydrolase
MKSLAKLDTYSRRKIAGNSAPTFINGFNFPIDSTTLSGSKPQSQTYLDTGVINSQRSKKKSRSDTFKARQKTKKHLALLAAEIHESELSEKLLRCHSRLGFLTCGRHIHQIIPNYVCEFKLCPDCARRKSRKRLNKYLPVMTAFVKQNRVTPVHLVLTQTHKKETRKQSIKRLRTAFNNLIRREFWKEHFKGGTWSIEFAKDKDNLHHTHLHIIGFRTKFFDIDLLRAEWFSVTGDSFVLRLDPITELSKGLLEVFKYVSKPLDTDRFTAEDLRDFLKLRNTHLFGSFGEFRTFKSSYVASDDDKASLPDYSRYGNLVEGCVCPSDNCDRPLFEKRRSAVGFVHYVKKIEAFAPN